MNQCQFIGNLVADPETTTPAGKTKVRFRLAVDRHLGAGKKETAFLRFEAWEKRAEFVAQYFKKGDGVAVVASVSQDNWTDKDGNKRSELYFRVNEVNFLPGSKKAGQAGEPANAGDAPAARQSRKVATNEELMAPAAEDDSQIPF